MCFSCSVAKAPVQATWTAGGTATRLRHFQDLTKKSNPRINLIAPELLGTQEMYKPNLPGSSLKV
jgi:hypothetical protein